MFVLKTLAEWASVFPPYFRRHWRKTLITWCIVAPAYVIHHFWR